MLGYEAPYKEGVFGSRQNPLWGLTKNRIIQSNLYLKFNDLMIALMGNRKFKMPSQWRENPPWRFVEGEKYGALDWGTFKIRQWLSSLSHLVFWKAIDVMDSQNVHPAVKTLFGLTLLLPMLITGIALGIASAAIYTVIATIAEVVALALLFPVLIPLNIVTNEIRKSKGLEKITMTDSALMGEKETVQNSLLFSTDVTGQVLTSDDFKTSAKRLGVRQQTMDPIETDYTSGQEGPNQHQGCVLQ